MAVSLVACSSNTSNSSETAGSNQSSQPETVTIKSLNANGDEVDLEVPYDPQRIAILDMASLDILDALGVGDCGGFCQYFSGLLVELCNQRRSYKFGNH